MLRYFLFLLCGEVVVKGLGPKFESKYEDKFYCKTSDGLGNESVERILVLSLHDDYFFKQAYLEDVVGKRHLAIPLSSVEH